MNKYLPLLFVILSGCSSYTEELQPVGSIIPASSILSVELEEKPHLIPNQIVSVRLSVSKIEKTKVDDVFINGDLLVRSDIGRATLNAKSITFVSKNESETLELDAFVVGGDGKNRRNIT